MSDLPPGWERVRLGDLGHEVRGSVKAEPGTTYEVYSVPTYPTGRPQLLRGEEIGSTKRPVEPGDVLLCKINPRINRVWAVAEPSGAGPQIASTEYLVFRTPDAGLSAYLRWYFHGPSFRRWIELSAEGATGSHTRAKSGPILEQSIPIPPVEEQERIVAALEEYVSRLDAAEAATVSAERRIEALERSIIMRTSSTLNPPEHWQVVTVADVGAVGLGLQRSPRRHTGPNMRPYLRVANVFEDRIDDSDLMSMDMTDAEWERFKLREGDVLLNEGQSPELLGRPAIYRGDPPDVAFTNSLIRFQAGDGVDPEWALLVFRSHMHTRRFMRESQITTNIAHLASGRFKTVEFPVPPLDEQRARAREARSQMETCSRLRSEVATARRRAAGLRRSVLAAAFSGKLVAHGSDDEFASVFLKRIPTERAVTTTHKRTQNTKTA